MKIPVRIAPLFALALVATAIVGGPSVTAAARVGSTPWAGKWRSTNFGVMTLKQTGGVVHGSYTYKGGRVSGTASGRVFRGTWTQLPTRRPPNDEGQFVFTLAANGTSWTSRWRYDSSGAWYTNWSGTRVATG